MTSSRLLWALSRRALARSSSTVMPGVSSTKIGASASGPCGQPQLGAGRGAAACRSGVRACLPAPRSRAGAARAAASTFQARKWRSDAFREWRHLPRPKEQNEVFPVDGRPATMTRSPFWRPVVISSSSVNPVSTPLKFPFA